MTDLSKIDVLDKGYVRLVDVLGSDLSVVNAARVSYDKESTEFDQHDQRLLSYLLREGHTSPLRHAALTLEVYAPLMVARQHWKYAVSSTFVDDQNGWNESSRRYITEESKFYNPGIDEWRSAPENSKQGSGPNLPHWDPETMNLPDGYDDMGSDAEQFGNFWNARLEQMQHIGQMYYEEALEWGVAPELARLFLPAYGLYVRYRWTVSLAGVLNFLDQRVAHDAQKEIQDYARAVATLTLDAFPRTAEAWAWRNG